jgi:hypothetical protein
MRTYHGVFLALLLVAASTLLPPESRAQDDQGDTLQFVRDQPLTDSIPAWRRLYGFDPDSFAIAASLINDLWVNGSIANVPAYLDDSLGIRVLETRMTRIYDSRRLDSLIAAMTGRLGDTAWGRRLIMAAAPWYQLGWAREVQLYPFDSAQSPYWWCGFKERSGGEKHQTPYRDIWKRYKAETAYASGNTTAGDTILKRVVFGYNDTVHIRRWPLNSDDNDYDGVENSWAFFTRSDLDWDDDQIGNAPDGPEYRPHAYFLGLLGHVYPDTAGGLGVGVDEDSVLFTLTFWCQVPAGMTYHNAAGQKATAQADTEYVYATRSITKRDLQPTGAPPNYSMFHEVMFPINMVQDDPDGPGGPLHPDNNTGGRIDIRVVWNGHEKAALRAVILRDTLAQLLVGNGGAGDQTFQQRILDTLDRIMEGPWYGDNSSAGRDSAAAEIARRRQKIIRFYAGDESFSAMFVGYNWLDSTLYHRYGGGDSVTGGIRTYKAEAYNPLSTWTMSSANENSVELYRAVLPENLQQWRFGLPTTLNGMPFGVGAIAEHNGGRFGTPLLNLEGTTARDSIDLFTRANQRIIYGAYITGHSKYPYGIGVNGFGRAACVSRATGRPFFAWLGNFSRLQVTWDSANTTPHILAGVIDEAADLRLAANLALCYGARGFHWYNVGCNLHEFDASHPVEVEPGVYRHPFGCDFGAPGPDPLIDTADRLDLQLSTPSYFDPSYTITIDSFYTGWVSRTREIQWIDKWWTPRLWPYLRDLRWRDGYSIHFTVQQAYNTEDSGQMNARPIDTGEVVTAIRTYDRYGHLDSLIETYVELGLFDTHHGAVPRLDSAFIMLVNRRTFERPSDVSDTSGRGRLMDSLAEWRRMVVQLRLPRIDTTHYL